MEATLLSRLIDSLSERRLVVCVGDLGHCVDQPEAFPSVAALRSRLPDVIPQDVREGMKQESDLFELAEYCVICMPELRRVLNDFLQEQFRSLTPSAIHFEIARMCFPKVIYFGWDNLLISAYKSETQGCPVGVITSEAAVTQYVTRLYNELNSNFKITEIEEIGFKLGVDPERLKKQTKDEFARALIQHLQNRQQLPELERLLRSERKVVLPPLDVDDGASASRLIMFYGQAEGNPSITTSDITDLTNRDKMPAPARMAYEWLRDNFVLILGDFSPHQVALGKLLLPRRFDPQKYPSRPVLVADRRRYDVPDLMDVELVDEDLAEFLASFADEVKARRQRGRRRIPVEPFLFLDYYTEAHKDIFFGRASDVKQLRKMVAEQTLSILIGESGIGKTSLLRAGLIPDLTKEYTAVYAAVGTDPFKAIKDAALKQLPKVFQDEFKDQEASTAVLDILFGYLSFEHRKPLLIVLDQFEDLMTKVGSETARRFVEAILAWKEQGQRKIILSLRADRFGELIGDNFAGLVKSFSQVYRLPGLKKGEARDAIEQPALMAELEFGKPLVDQLIKDLLAEGGRDDIDPTQMSIVCYRLFEERPRDLNKIELSLYESLGGLAGILNAYLDWALERLPDQTQKEAHNVLKELVTPDGRKAAVTIEEITLHTGYSQKKVVELLEILVAQRLVRKLEADPPYELAHDRSAERILAWLNQDELDRKAIDQMLQQELRDHTRWGSLIHPAKLNVINSLHEPPRLPSQMIGLLIESSMFYEVPLERWRHWLREAQDSVALRPLLDKVNETMSDDLRVRAIRALGITRTQEARQQLLTALDDRSDRLVLAALTGLVEWEPDEEALRRVAPLLQHQNLAIRQTALNHIVSSEQPIASELILPAVQDRALRLEVIQKLGELGHPSGIGGLIHLLTSSDATLAEAAEHVLNARLDSQPIALTTARGLSDLVAEYPTASNERALRLLKTLALYPLAQQTLGQIAVGPASVDYRLAALDILLGQPQVEGVDQLLSRLLFAETEPRIVEHALRTLDRTDEGSDVFESYLQVADDPVGLGLAASALIKRKHPELIPARVMAVAATHPDTSVRRAILETLLLAEPSGERALTIVRIGTLDRDKGLRQRAQSLPTVYQQFIQENIAYIIRESLETPSLLTRLFNIYIVPQVSQAQAINYLSNYIATEVITLPRGKRPPISEIADWLVGYGGEQGIFRAIELLHDCDEDGQVFQSLLNALGKSRADWLDAYLLGRLVNEKEKVMRNTLIRCLRERRFPESPLRELEHILASDKKDRARTLNTMLHVRDDTHYQLACAMLEHEDALLREAAIRVLPQWTKSRTVKLLEYAYSREVNLGLKEVIIDAIFESPSVEAESVLRRLAGKEKDSWLKEHLTERIANKR